MKLFRKRPGIPEHGLQVGIIHLCYRTSWECFSRKLSELGSRLDFGVQGLGRGIGAAAGQKWSFRVRRMSISLRHGFPVLS